MSRSRRKAIVKDVGHLKKVYWRIYRRVNNQIVKHFFDNAKHRVSCYDNWDDFFMYKNRFIEKGYSEEEAHIMAYEEVEDNEDFPICSNCHIDWAEEPCIISPKQLIDDYDYSDYTLDYEYSNPNHNTPKLRRK